jgi:enoyl-[acyl-carrier protein] reductase I
VAGRFEGKRGLVTGVANKRSIAWAIGRRLAEEGAQLAFTYQGERIEKNVRELAESVDSPLITSCDVRSDEDVDRVMREVGETFDGELDVLVHSVAFAAAEDLEGRFTDTPRDRFWLALDVSAYSLVALARAAEPLMEAAGGGSIMTMTYLGGKRAVPHYNVMGVAKAALNASVRYLAWELGEKQIRVNAVSAARAAEPLMEAAGGGSILTMTYLGGERAVPHYNVMGVAKAALDASMRYLAWDLGQKNIRVNAVSAGPVRTLAARSIAGFPTMEAIVEERAPLHRPISAEDVGAAAAFLLSDDAQNVTGTTLYVDSGYHAMGM